MEKSTSYSDYRKSLIQQMWRYRKERFAGCDDLFDTAIESEERPPVFTRAAACHNVTVKPGGEHAQDIRSKIEPRKRHRWFQRMMSLQLPPHCDGSYSLRNGKDRCYLSYKNVAYWQHIPKLFEWSSDKCYSECPLRKTYQLVRNVLAACVGPDCSIDPAAGHAVLLYDSRNPAFQHGGEGWKAFALAKGALKEARLLRSCTWQQVAAVIRQDSDLAWLSEELQMKYGL